MKKSEYLFQHALEAKRKTSEEFSADRCNNVMEGALINLRETVFKAKIVYSNALTEFASGDVDALIKCQTAKKELDAAERAIKITEAIRDDLNSEVDDNGEPITKK